MIIRNLRAIYCLPVGDGAFIVTDSIFNDTYHVSYYDYNFAGLYTTNNNTMDGLFINNIAFPINTAKCYDNVIQNGILCGVNAKGSIKGGELFTKVCLGGISDVGISIPGDLSDIMAMPAVKVKTDFPALSTLGSQKAGWKIDVDGYYAIASGPAQTHKFKNNPIYEMTGYVEESDVGVSNMKNSSIIFSS